MKIYEKLNFTAASSRQNSFLYILKAYMMVHIIKKFRDSSFSQSEVKLWSSQPKTQSKNPSQNRVKKAINTLKACVALI